MRSETGCQHVKITVGTIHIDWVKAGLGHMLVGVVLLTLCQNLEGISNSLLGGRVIAHETAQSEVGETPLIDDASGTESISCIPRVQA
jgi:hypothetical protein